MRARPSSGSVSSSLDAHIRCVVWLADLMFRSDLGTGVTDSTLPLIGRLGMASTTTVAGIPARTRSTSVSWSNASTSRSFGSGKEKSRIRSRTLRAPTVDESDLTIMANDPAIQRELQQIDAEFSATEADGLGRI